MNEEQQQNEEHRQMKIQQQNKDQKWNEQQQHKNLTGGSPKQSTIAGSFWFKKKIDYRSVIDITFTSNIVLHLVVISICNKDNG